MILVVISKCLREQLLIAVRIINMVFLVVFSHSLLSFVNTHTHYHLPWPFCFKVSLKCLCVPHFFWLDHCFWCLYGFWFNTMRTMDAKDRTRTLHTGRGQSTFLWMILMDCCHVLLTACFICLPHHRTRTFAHTQYYNNEKWLWVFLPRSFSFHNPHWLYFLSLFSVISFQLFFLNNSNVRAEDDEEKEEKVLEEQKEHIK